MTAPTADRATSSTAIWIALLIVGQVSLFQFIPWLADNGLDLSLAKDDLLATRMSTGAFLDLTMSSVTLWVFVVLERRIASAQMALVAVTNLILGLSFALPLYLLLRSRSNATAVATA